MQQDREIVISVANNRASTNWTASRLMWSDFCGRLRLPLRTSETIDQYLKLKKSQQDDLKDVGGFMGGSLDGVRRKANAVTGRDLITLDLDNIGVDGAKPILSKVEGLGCAYVVYSTRKHTPAKPRLRVIFPTDRTMTADEYEPLARKMAELVGIEYADPTTFEASRFMYWPSCSSDSEYLYKVVDKPFLSADGVLRMYQDWRDVTTWPQVPGHEAEERRLVAKQEDPETKKGIVGAFCRVYDIYGAMETFIPKMYDGTPAGDRFTYLGGSTTGGAVVYEGGKFLYSHHATDPCGGKLVNAWDLVRLHMYGDLDDEAKDGTPVFRMPSYEAMRDLAMADDRVAGLVAQERAEHAAAIFDDAIVADDIDDHAWMQKLSVDKNGKVENTTNNAVLILENDTRFKGHIALDEFASRGIVIGSVPWYDNEGTRLWTDLDDAETRSYMEAAYEIKGRDKIDDALTIVSFRHRINAVKEYLVSLTWDGTKRIDTLLHDYLGAEQSVYSAAIMRKFLAAAAGRAVAAPIKFDYMPIMTGPQGIGKSTFLAKLGRKWFSDSLTVFEGKEAAELIQGTWINEIGELSAFNKSESNNIKQFLSKQDDIYRAAYGRRTEQYPRRCVFFGTSNEMEFLRDTTGNRRFWPIEVGVERPTKSIWEDLDDEVDQIWAEAYLLYQFGEPLYMTGEAKILAEEHQSKHREHSTKEGMIEEYLSLLVPEHWDSMSLSARRLYLSGHMKDDGYDTILRNKICALEIWCEVFNGDPKYMDRRTALEINGILQNMPGWTRNRGTRRYGYCGQQRGFDRDMLEIFQDIKTDV